MSGGSMNYIYSMVDNHAVFELNTPERVAFAKHLKLIVNALHDIEWVDSCDYGPGGDTESILACIGTHAVLEASIERAEQAKEELERLLEQAKDRV